jgi:ADP-ribosylglycohydrolase
VLGALLGAQGGMHAVPQAWINGLHEHDRLKGLLEKLSALALKGG